MRPASISVSEASSRMGVSKPRVRDLIQTGSLGAGKVAGRWLLDPLAVERWRGAEHRAGRPFSPENAWGLLFLTAGEDAPWLDRVARSKLRRRLREKSLLQLARRLRNRARVHRLRAHPSDLPRIREEPGVVLGGASAASRYGFDVIAPRTLEAYVEPGRLHELARKYVLEPGSDPNVILREIAGRWPFQGSLKIVPESVAAIDLLEADDERSCRAGREALERLGRR